MKLVACFHFMQECGITGLAVILSVLASPPATAASRVAMYGIFERSLQHTGDYGNPYVQVTATAKLTSPDGATTRQVPLFWDGGKTWKLRFSPDQTGLWSYHVASTDPGLDGEAGQFHVVAGTQQGSIQPITDYPRHFQRQDGSPFWFLGDTAWALYTDNQAERHDRHAVVEYLDARALQGFNVVHSMLLSEAGWGNQGGPPFEDLASERLNPGYWQEVDWRLDYANRRGLVAGLVLAWGDKRRVEPYAWRKFPTFESRIRYARYVAARYSAFDVYFIVAGEWNAEVNSRSEATPSSVRREFVAIGDALWDADPHHRMVAIHPMTREGSVRDFAGSRWMAFGDYQQNYRHLHARVLQSRPSHLPVVNAEYGYYLRDSNGDGLVDKPNSIDAASMRHATWDIVMAGGYVVTGFGTTYFGGNRDPGPFLVDAPQNVVWQRQVQHVRQLFTSLAWWKLQPADQAITADTPRSPDGTRRDAGRGRPVTVPPDVAYWMLADAGQTYIAYVRGYSGPYRIRLAAGEYRLQRFDPRTGRCQSLGKAVIRTPYTFQPPDIRDWVLAARRG